MESARPGSARRDENWELLKAAEDGDLPAMSLAVRRGASVHYHSPADGATGLHVSARWNQVAAIRFLVAQNAALNAFDLFKQTPLHAAAAAGAARAVAELANLGAAIGAEDEERLTPLHLAARNGHADVILALLRLGADVEAKSMRGVSPAELAEQHGRPDIRTLIVHSCGRERLSDEPRNSAAGVWHCACTVCERARLPALDARDDAWRARPPPNRAPAPAPGSPPAGAAPALPRWRAMLLSLAEALAGCADHRGPGLPRDADGLPARRGGDGGWTPRGAGEPQVDSSPAMLTARSFAATPRGGPEAPAGGASSRGDLTARSSASAAGGLPSARGSAPAWFAHVLADARESRPPPGEFEGLGCAT